MTTSSHPRPSVARSTLINLAGAIVPALLLLFTVPHYLALIGEARYGVLALVWLLLGYFGIFDLGFGRAVANKMAALHDAPAEARENVFWTGWLISLATGLLGGLLLYGAGSWLFAYVFHVPPFLRGEVEAAMPWLVLALPLATSLSLLAGTLEGRQAFLSMNMGQIAGTVAYQLLPLGLAYAGYHSLAVFIPAAIGGRLVSVLLLFQASRRQVPLQSMPRVDASLIKLLFRYGGWITVTGAIGPLLTVFDRFLIGSQIGMAAVTAYTVPYNLVTYLSVLPGSLQTALFPNFSRLSTAEALDLLRRSLLTILAVFSPVIVLAELLVKPFLILWIGAKLAAEAAPVAQILLLGIWINAIAYMPFAYLQGRGRPDLPARFHLLELAPYGVLLWLGIGWLGIAGAAWVWTLRVTADYFLLVLAAKVRTIHPMLILSLLPVLAVFVTAQTLPYDSRDYDWIGICLFLIAMLLSYYTLPKSIVLTALRRHHS
ncbi:flippase [Acidithiobacillus sp. CV18-2]|nr:flippase [Acidithiobacillus sp. CV18-3]MBU2755913.1 flippase [Acidithiobacillus sp. BN09-2]MBU2778113.1 flippase [Acidithiobacillus sp. CV18-2]MBU2800161.1 flippase [Acidithiobacillus sp. VAN18-4]